MSYPIYKPVRLFKTTMKPTKIINPSGYPGDRGEYPTSMPKAVPGLKHFEEGKKEAYIYVVIQEPKPNGDVQRAGKTP